MATTLVNFVPSTVAPFTFQPTLAGTTYNASIEYLAQAQRYYLNLTDLYGTPVLYCALTETGPSFQGQLTWKAGVAIVTLTEPHNVPIGQLANGRISGTDSGFDGDFQMLATKPLTLTYALGEDPLVEPIAGVLNFDNNLVNGVVDGGLLLYHSDTQVFEFA